ncbi:MAG: HAMP domain-containing histidine kinase [Mogibacterium sp.]|nr:HAMP domain-containing histidine kinase [Mogibacterium sp.]
MQKSSVSRIIFGGTVLWALCFIFVGLFKVWRNLSGFDGDIYISHEAAGEIFAYGGLALIGILLLLFIILLMDRINSANKTELEEMTERADTLEEINRKMQALAHHQRLETIGTMAASIAHDFNNLLTPIMGYSIMTMEMVPADQTDIQENLLEVYNASVKAKEIVQGLADLTKKGRVEDFSEIDVEELVRSALKVTLPAKPKNVEIKVGFKQTDKKIKGDNTQLSQLVMNMVLNAYDAMKPGGGELFVSTRAIGDEISLSIRDTGSGMDAETVSRIFDPFYTTKESGKGTGLGLAIAAQVVETHGGRIYVNSKIGSGTEFRIVFPTAGASVLSRDTREFDRAKLSKEDEQ